MARFGERVWFRKIGEDGVSSFASRMTQGIFVGHHDRTGAVLCITKNGVVRGKSWTRQTLSDAWESANWEGLCRSLKKVTADKEGAGPHGQGLWLKERRRLSLEGSYVLSADIKAHGCPSVAILAQVRSHFGSSHFGSRSRRSLSFWTVV